MIRPARRSSSNRVRHLAALAAVMAGLGLLAPVASARPGDVDGGFGSGGFAPIADNSRLFGVATASDGRVFGVGYLDTGGGRRLAVARLSRGGAVQGYFTAPASLGETEGHAIAIGNDGKIVVAGISSSGGIVVGRLNSSGTAADGSFAGGFTRLLGRENGQANAVAVQPDGKVVVGGSANLPDGYPRLALVRLSRNGSPDGGFGSGGTRIQDLGRNSQANGIALQTDGKIVVAGSQSNNFQTTDALAARFNTNGSLDGGFAGGGLIRQYSTGAPFSAFNDVAIEPSGRIVAVGIALNQTSTNTLANALIVGLTRGGAQDGGFGSGGVVKLPAGQTEDQPANHPGAYSVRVVHSANLVIAGSSNAGRGNGRRDVALWGLTLGGALNSGFGSGGSRIVPRAFLAGGTATDLAVYSDRLLISGYDRNVVGGTSRGFAARFLGFPAKFVRGRPGVSVAGGSRSRIKIRSNRRLSLTFTNTNDFSVRVSLKIRSSKRLRVGGRRRTVTFVSKSFTLGPESKRTITFRISRSNLRLLRKLRRIRVTATLSLRDPTGGKATVRKRFTFSR